MWITAKGNEYRGDHCEAKMRKKFIDAVVGRKVVLARCATFPSSIAEVDAWLSHMGYNAFRCGAVSCIMLHNVFTGKCTLSCRGTCGGVAASLHLSSPHLLWRASKASPWVQISRAKVIEWVTKGDIEKKELFSCFAAACNACYKSSSSSSVFIH